MAEYQAIVKDAEVNGETVLSVVSGMEIFKQEALKILSDNGIKDPKPGQWYPQQSWLNAFRSISNSVGRNTLFLIGKKIPESAQWPPFVNSIETALASIDIAYHMNHRIKGTVLFDPKSGKMTEGIGHYNFSKVGERNVKMICDNPYPCDFDRGIIEAAAKKFKPDDAVINIAHDASQTCRSKGGGACTYIVTW